MKYKGKKITFKELDKIFFSKDSVNNANVGIGRTEVVKEIEDINQQMLNLILTFGPPESLQYIEIPRTLQLKMYFNKNQNRYLQYVKNQCEEIEMMNNTLVKFENFIKPLSKMTAKKYEENFYTILSILNNEPYKSKSFEELIPVLNPYYKKL